MTRTVRFNVVFAGSQTVTLEVTETDTVAMVIESLDKKCSGESGISEQLEAQRKQGGKFVLLYGRVLLDPASKLSDSAAWVSNAGRIAFVFQAEKKPAALPFAAAAGAGAGGASAGPGDAPASPAATCRARTDSADSALSL